MSSKPSRHCIIGTLLLRVEVNSSVGGTRVMDNRDSVFVLQRVRLEVGVTFEWRERVRGMM